MTWAERAADRSPVVQRSRTRGVEQATAIVRAARRLIETKGPSFTTQELIKEAGIALQTFYRYFPGKDQLLLAVIEDIIDENCQTLPQAAPASSTIRWTGCGSTSPRPSTDLKGPHNGPQLHHRGALPAADALSRRGLPGHPAVHRPAAGRDPGGRGRRSADPGDPDYSAWLITQLAMAVFHHYDCAGLDEPAERIADRLWNFCLAALNEGAPARSGARSRRALVEPAGGSMGAPTPNDAPKTAPRQP